MANGKSPKITYNNLCNKIDEYNSRRVESDIFEYTAENWANKSTIDLKSFIVTYVIENMAYNYGNDFVSSFASDKLSDLSNKNFQTAIVKKHAKDYGVNISECVDIYQAQANMEVNGCEWNNLPEVKEVLYAIAKEHSEQMKGR